MLLLLTALQIWALGKIRVGSGVGGALETLRKAGQRALGTRMLMGDLVRRRGGL